jgi:hypothetical protein
MVKKQKKAMGMEDAIMLIYRIIILAVAVFVFMLFVNMLVTPFKISPESISEVYLSRVIYSDSIYFVDSTRTYTNIIDIDKLNSKDNLTEYFREEFYNEEIKNMMHFQLSMFYEYDFEKWLNQSDEIHFNNLDNKNYTIKVIQTNPEISIKVNDGKRASTQNLQINELANFTFENFELEILEKNNDLIKVRYGSSTKSAVFSTNPTEYYIMYGLTRARGRGAVLEVFRRFGSTCKINNKFIPCKTELSLLVSRSFI